MAEVLTGRGVVEDAHVRSGEIALHVVITEPHTGWLTLVKAVTERKVCRITIEPMEE